MILTVDYLLLKWNSWNWHEFFNRHLQFNNELQFKKKKKFTKYYSVYLIKELIHKLPKEEQKTNLKLASLLKSCFSHDVEHNYYIRTLLILPCQNNAPSINTLLQVSYKVSSGMFHQLLLKQCNLCNYFMIIIHNVANTSPNRLLSLHYWNIHISKRCISGTF